MPLSDPQIRRYARHVLLPDVGGIGQARLLAATVAIDLDVDRPAAIVAASYLAAAGVGTLALRGGRAPVDDADVAAGIALGAADRGRPLVDALADRLRAQNPDVSITDDAAPVLAIAGEAPGDTVADALVRGGLAACRAVALLVARP